MHIKTGTWEASNTVCESNYLCDPAVLVTATNAEPYIRNRRLSPGSGTCGGGGGGGFISADHRQPSPEADLAGPGCTQTLGPRREKDRRGQQQQQQQQHKGRSLRREGQKGVVGRVERPRKVNQKDRWVEDSLPLLKPPPSFPVQDSPAKLQPAVSYASKVKARAATPEEDRPAIGVLLQNQWGLSFISEARPAAECPGLRPADGALPAPPTDAQDDVDPPAPSVLPVLSPEEPLSPLAAPQRPEFEESDGKMLLSCRHLIEALNYHNREWNTLCNKQKKDPQKVVWYKAT